MSAKENIARITAVAAIGITSFACSGESKKTPQEPTLPQVANNTRCFPFTEPKGPFINAVTGESIKMPRLFPEDVDTGELCSILEMEKGAEAIRGALDYMDKSSNPLMIDSAKQFKNFLADGRASFSDFRGNEVVNVYIEDIAKEENKQDIKLLVKSPARYEGHANGQIYEGPRYDNPLTKETLVFQITRGVVFMNEYLKHGDVDKAKRTTDGIVSFGLPRDFEEKLNLDFISPETTVYKNLLSR